MAESPDTGGWYFERPFSPGAADRLADEVCGWLRSEALRWLLANVPGRREPGAPAVPLPWPTALTGSPGGGGREELAGTVAALAEICDWERPGTAWDFRSGGERRADDDPPSEPGPPATAIAARAAALGLRSSGRPVTGPGTLVVLGGRRLAPLARARAAAASLAPGCPTRVLMLCSHRPLDEAERRSPEVRGYAPGARTERDLMAAATRAAFATEPGRGRVRLAEVPAPAGAERASTDATLLALAGELGAAGEPVAVVTSPTCRPFQHLEAVRVLGLGAGLACETFAHAPAASTARPHVYLQEIRSAIQAAGRLAAALAPGTALAGERSAALA